jgi:hypothetical protein
MVFEWFSERILSWHGNGNFLTHDSTGVIKWGLEAFELEMIGVALFSTSDAVQFPKSSTSKISYTTIRKL